MSEETPTIEQQLQQKNTELHNLQHEFENFKQLMITELEQRDAREYELLRRLYPYITQELDAFRTNRHPNQRQEE